MKYALVLIGYFQLLSLTCAAGVSDSLKPNLSKRLYRLAQRIKLPKPQPEAGEHEIRIWNSVSFQHGDAQSLYLLTKNTDRLSIHKYILKSGKRGFRSARKIVPIKPITDSSWQRLLDYGILSLPHEALINSQTHPDNSPRAIRAGTVENDGSYTIYGQKIQRSVQVLDGESYFFESFSADGYQLQNYDNPKGYLRAMPDIVELQKVVRILDTVASFFATP